MADDYAPVIDLAAARLRRECVRWGATARQMEEAADDPDELALLKDRLVRSAMRAPGPRAA